MAKARLPDWMTGAETWGHLKGIYPDETDREVRIMLHSAVKDSQVAARLSGRNAEETFLDTKGLVGDVEGDWIREFILSDADEVDWETFLRRTNFLRKDLLTWLGSKPRPRITKSKRGVSGSNVAKFVSQFFADEIKACRTPSKLRLYKAAGRHLPAATRHQLKEAYKKQAVAQNVHLKPGRPKTLRDNSPE